MKRQKKDQKAKPRKHVYVCPRCSSQFDTIKGAKISKVCPICDNKGLVREDKLLKDQQHPKVQRPRVGPINGAPVTQVPVDKPRTRRGLDKEKGND
jgi:DNA-directed RNA polymerase subunit RPC12/RpoP